MARQKSTKNNQNLVTYGNKFNDASLSSLNPVEIKLLHAVITQLKDRGTEEVTIPYDSLKQLIFDNTNRTTGEITAIVDNAVLPIMQSSINRIEHQDGKIEYVPLISKVSINPNDRTFSVSVHEEATFLFNNIVREFTSFPMADFSQLKHSCSLILYRQLMQWKSVGVYNVSVEDLKSIMLDEEHRKSFEEFKIFNRDYIKKAVKEINDKFPAMNLSVDYIRESRQTKALIFRFNKFVSQKALDAEFKDVEENSEDELLGYIAMVIQRQPNNSEMSIIRTWKEIGIADELIKSCFAYADEKASVRYCDAILKAWKSKGYKRPSDVPELLNTGLAYDPDDVMQLDMTKIPVWEE